jgi:hypothetical protein
MMLAALLHSSGGGAPFVAQRLRRCRLLALVLFATFAGVAMFSAASALASSAARPTIEWVNFGPLEGYNKNADELYVFPTHMFAAASVRVDGLATKWRAEYSTSKSAIEADAGTVASSGELPSTVEGGSGEVQFGPVDPGGIGSLNHVLHHLTPGTRYYAQFFAENADGEAVLPIEFTTPPVAKPEVDKYFFIDSGLKPPQLDVVAVSPTTVTFNGQLESNGAATSYTFGLSAGSPSGPVTSCGGGSVSVAEDFREFEGQCMGLAPETTYYVHLVMTNDQGTTEQTTYGEGGENEFDSVVTPTSKPIVEGEPSFRNITAESAHVEAGLRPHHQETRWRFESAPSALGPWDAVPGASGTISQAQAEALPEGSGEVNAALTGLGPAKTYYVRLFAENAAGEGEYCYLEGAAGKDHKICESVSTATHGSGSFATTGPPTVGTFAVHSLGGESLRLLGEVDPTSTPTSAEQVITIAGAPSGGTFTLTFKGQTTATLPYDAEGGAVEHALNALSTIAGDRGDVFVTGPGGGPYTVVFTPEDEDGVNHNPLAEKPQPLIEADGSGLTPSGSVGVVTSQAGGEAYDASYRFQYIGQKDFEAEGGFAGAVVGETPEVDVGSGSVPRYVAADLPGLTPGESYRYRIVATSTYPGNPVVDGAEQVLTVPAAPAVEAGVSCPNEALRTGASAALPDCRAYEQLTPVFKEGAREPFNYGTTLAVGVVVGEDGEHVLLEDEAVNWGAGPGAGQSPYVFSRAESGGWLMSTASPQPETAVNRPIGQLFGPDLGGFAFSSKFSTSTGSTSKEEEFKEGPPGGPYVTVASIPFVEKTNPSVGWVGSSRDFSRLFLQVEDHTLLGSATGTKHGEDLYEYAGGELHQVNVTGPGPGATIGACGANIVKGREEGDEQGVSSAHAVSASGERVFFEAAPGKDCSEAKDLYVRENGESTVEIGAYKFLAANNEGSEVLLEKHNGETYEALLYDTESNTVTPLFSTHSSIELSLRVSGELDALYFTSSEQLPNTEAPPPTGSEETSIYRYDVATEKLSFIDAGSYVTLTDTSPDGGDLYFHAESLEGVPGGAQSGTDTSPQVYRYDSAESVVQCMSCASSFDPVPKLLSVFFGEFGGNDGVLLPRTWSPRPQFASANGDYVFFDTPSALVPSDVDGEVEPENTDVLERKLSSVEVENLSTEFSASSDVYEWRKVGVDGCTHLQGCLALITNGRGGYLNLFLGTDESGRDAFIYSRSRLGPRDDDNAGDIYDARIDGGEAPPPPRPVECEGDACSTPPSPPNDATPSSLTFNGNGNAAQPPATKPAVKTTKPKAKKKSKKKRKQARLKRRHKAKKSSHTNRSAKR